MVTRRWYESVGQEVVETTLDNGLRVAVLPKPGFQTRFAAFTTRYGGVDNSFVPEGSAEPVELPAGIAHFLEHKLFEQADGTNIADRYSRMGADCNAGTYRNRTDYHFTVSDSEKFMPAFEMLLDYVQEPYFTDENVAKEQGIIQQEIAAGLDRPGTIVSMNLEAALFKVHPLRVATIGTAETVGRITKEDLYLCHRTFYHPSNMMVTVSGDVDPSEVVDAVARDMAGRSYAPAGPIERPTFVEPQAVADAEVTRGMKVSRPLVRVGYKGPVGQVPEPQALQRRQLMGAVIGDALFGRTAAWYWGLYSSGVITRDFAYGLVDYASASYFVVLGETEDMPAFTVAVDDALRAARDRGVQKEDFELSRRAAVGRLLTYLDSPEDTALSHIGDAVNGIDSLTSRDVLESLTLDEANGFLAGFVAEDRRVVSSVVPMAGGEERK